MDKLRHIDALLNESLGQSVETGVYTSDWLAIEKRLKRRKNRIYAMWFSLSLILLTSVSLVVFNLNTSKQDLSNNSTQEITQPIIENPIVDNTTPTENTSDNLNTENIVEGPSNTQSNPTDESANTTTTESNTVDENNTIDNSTDIASNSGTQESYPELELSIRTAAISYLTGWNNLVFNHYFSSELEHLNLDYLDYSTSTKKSLFGFSHIEMGVSFTPSIASKLTSERADLGGLINKRYRDIASQSESASFASSTAFNFEYHFTSGLFIGTGFGITQRTEAVNYDYIIDEFPVVDEVNNVIEQYVLIQPQFRDQINYNGSNSYHFIEIPMTLGYAANIGRKFEIRNQIDLSYMLLFNKIGQKADYTYLTLNDLNTVDYLNNSNLSSTFKSGVYYKFKNFVIGAEPTVSMNLNSLSNNSSAIKIKPYYYGFNLTTNIKLNRK